MKKILSLFALAVAFTATPAFAGPFGPLMQYTYLDVGYEWNDAKGEKDARPTNGVDTKLSIYEDLCGPYGAGTALYCNDDACGPNGWRSSLQDVTLVAGQTYFIIVDGYGPTDKGPFELCFDFSCFSDLNHDGLIGTADLMLLLVGFGTQYNLESLMWFLADHSQTCLD